MFNSILVAVDGSEQSEDAVIAGCTLANEQDATLTILHAPIAYNDTVVLGASAAALPPSIDEIEKAAKEVIAKAKALAEENGAKKIKTAIQYGPPAKTIVDYADKHSIDLIVMGRRGLGTLSGLLIGSVTSKVQQLAPCAVLTVK